MYINTSIMWTSEGSTETLGGVNFWIFLKQNPTQLKLKNKFNARSFNEKPQFITDLKAKPKIMKIYFLGSFQWDRKERNIAYDALYRVVCPNSDTLP